MRIATLALGAVTLIAACGGSGTGTGSGSGAGSGSGSGAGTSSGGGPGPGPACTAQDPHSGDGTYYDADGSGNCSFDPTNDLLVGAMNHVDYASSAVCGACVHIKGPVGEVTVRVVDQCPECKQGDIDLSPQAFMPLADLSLGRIPITWTYVSCDVKGPIVYHFKEGSNQWWTAVQIRNARYAIDKLEFQQNGSFVEVARLDYNYFVADSGMGPGPYTFRVTDVNGAQLVDTGVPFVEAGDSDGAAQLPDCSQ